MEVGSLADDVPLLPKQVILIEGLSVDTLKERRRTRPPQPPFPKPYVKGDALWYTLGEIRRYRAEKAENIAIQAELNRRHKHQPGFASWLNTSPAEPWPFALVGPHKRPVDVWSTIRGEVPMSRKDTVAFLTVAQYLEKRLAAARAEEAAKELAEAKAMAEGRGEQGKTAGTALPARKKPKQYT